MRKANVLLVYREESKDSRRQVPRSLQLVDHDNDDERIVSPSCSLTSVCVPIIRLYFPIYPRTRGAPCLVQAAASLLQASAKRCALCLAALQIGGTQDSAQRAANPDDVITESKKARDKTEGPRNRAAL